MPLDRRSPAPCHAAIICELWNINRVSHRSQDGVVNRQDAEREREGK
jgi:hypothetical protein